VNKEADLTAKKAEEGSAGAKQHVLEEACINAA